MITAKKDVDLPVKVAAFYHFVALQEPHQLQVELERELDRSGIRGTILLAEEGINGTIAGTPAAIDGFVTFLCARAEFGVMPVRYSFADAPPFLRAKVRVKREIVTLGIDGINPALQTGEHVPPDRWNALIAEDDVLLIDTRNQYEIAVGSFGGAVDPGTDSFRDFPDYVQNHLKGQEQRRIAMFCTGGIRCEKSTAYLKSQGFDHVYQLDGGILNYLEQVPASQSRFNGECFVFDGRVTVDNSLRPGEFEQCHACRAPISAADQAHPHYRAGVSCPFCYATTSKSQKARFAEREQQMRLAAARGEQHLGADAAADAEVNRVAKRAARLKGRDSE